MVKKLNKINFSSQCLHNQGNQNVYPSLYGPKQTKTVLLFGQRSRWVGAKIANYGTGSSKKVRLQKGSGSAAPFFLFPLTRGWLCCRRPPGLGAQSAAWWQPRQPPHHHTAHSPARSGQYSYQSINQSIKKSRNQAIKKSINQLIKKSDQQSKFSLNTKTVNHHICYLENFQYCFVCFTTAWSLKTGL